MADETIQKIVSLPTFRPVFEVTTGIKDNQSSFIFGKRDRGLGVYATNENRFDFHYIFMYGAPVFTYYHTEPYMDRAAMTIINSVAVGGEQLLLETNSTGRPPPRDWDT